MQVRLAFSTGSERGAIFWFLDEQVLAVGEAFQREVF